MSNTMGPLSNSKFQQRTVLAVMGGLLAILFLLLFAILITSIVSACSLPSKNDVNWVDMSVDLDDVKGGPLVLINGTHEYLFPADTHLVNMYGHQSSLENKFAYSGTGIELDGDAMTHAQYMLDAFASETGKPANLLFIGASSAYRSAKYQTDLNSSTKAGFSDHHSGMLLSFSIFEKGLYSIYDTDYAEYGTWLINNSYKYGYVQRYPEAKSAITGVSDYTEAFRYVGVPHAKYIHEEKLVLEEYINVLKDKATFKKPLIITADDGVRYLVYYAPVTEATNIKVPALDELGKPTYEYTVSGTNDGGVVVTVKLG